jgi:hypothetical protein
VAELRAKSPAPKTINATVYGLITFCMLFIRKDLKLIGIMITIKSRQFKMPKGNPTQTEMRMQKVSTITEYRTDENESLFVIEAHTPELSGKHYWISDGSMPLDSLSSCILSDPELFESVEEATGKTFAEFEAR